MRGLIWTSDCKMALGMARVQCTEVARISSLTEDRMRMIVAGVASLCNLPPEKHEPIVRRLMAELGVTKDIDVTLIDKTTYVNQDDKWYTTLKEQGENKRASAYEGCLNKKGWPVNVIRQLDVSTDEIMNLLGDPRLDEFDIRGLVMGEVQSGKTANYLALCNKVADAGYRVIIVTAGIIEKLRQQTQARLEDEFTSLIQSEPIPGLTTRSSDFKSSRKDTPVSFFREDRPVLCVVKKNVKVLRHLYEWLQKDAKRGKLNYPLLFIDDEADNASINTATNGRAPTKTNEWIRKILNSFKRSSYLGVTATPFANIFIDPDATRVTSGEDLFPKSFVRRLTSPSNYCGAKEIFAPGKTYPRIVTDLELWLPNKHKKDVELSPSLPASLQRAIGYFLLTVTAMDILEQKEYPIVRHRTMLVHISRFRAVHSRLRDCIKVFLERMKVKIKNYSGHPAIANDHEEIRLLHDIWQKEHFELRAEMPSWDIFLSQYLPSSTTSITVEIINSASQPQSLDFTDAQNNVRAIVIGGNALSRGLTLEGLVVSYFKRNTLMSDTLLQMARWFGYRGSYQEYVRVWLEEEALDAFGYAMDILDELSKQFDQMAHDGLSPKEFAFKLRASPASFLPTARNKLYSTHTETLQIDVETAIAGYAFETPRIPNHPDVIEQNNVAVFDFFNAIRDYSRDTGGWTTGVCYYRAIPSEVVSNFLKQFVSGNTSYDLKLSFLKEYIETDVDVLDIMVHTKVVDDIVSRGIMNPREEIYAAPRKVLINTVSSELQISGTKLKVSSGGEMKYTLLMHDAKTIEGTADALFLKKAYAQHRNPLLIVHHIKIKEKTEQMVTEDFFALSLGFPGDRSNTKPHRFIFSKKAYEAYFLNNDLEDNDDTEE